MAVMSGNLELLVRDCTVQVIGEARGTGFFVAPGIVVTCAHVIGNQTRPTVRWERNGQQAVEVIASEPARVIAHAEHPIRNLDGLYPDIALIEVPGLSGHPCVAVDDEWPQDPDTFYVCGYPREGDAELLTPVRLRYRGMHGTDPAAYLDLAGDTIKPGMSGAAVLNLRTGAVCGMLVATKHPKQADGGLAVLWGAAKDDLADCLAANRVFHQRERRWNAATQGRRRRRPRDIARPLPENYERRDDLLSEAKQELLAANPGGSARLVGLVGMGGIGKSVLACALARDDEVKQAFQDGIVWLDFGQRADPDARQRDLAAAFGDVDRQAVDWRHRLRDLNELLAGARCLVILDDVMQRQQLRYFELSAPESTLLVTARDRTVLGQSTMVRFLDVGVLPPDQAWRLLAAWASKRPSDLPPEAREVAILCDGLPLALSIAGAMVAQGYRWPYLRDAIRSADLHELEVGLPYYDTEYENLFRVLDVSVRCLEQPDQDCYLALAVFEGRGAVPTGAAIQLWRKLGLTEHDSEGLLIRLDRRSLLRYDQDAGTVSMHSLQYAYARGRLGEERLRDLHGLLATAILDSWGGLAQRLPGLPTSRPANPVERYGVVQLAGHLETAGRDEDIHRLLALSTPPSDGQPGQVENAWYTAHTRSGETIAYDGDLRLAWNRAKASSDQARAARSPAAAIGLEIRYALMSASLASLSARIPPSLITALVDDGQWTVGLGVRHARMLPSAEACARTLANLLARTGQAVGDATAAADLAAEALGTAQAVGDPFARAMILAALAAHPPSRTAAVREAWQAIDLIRAELPRARAFAALAASARLSKRQLEMAQGLAADSKTPRALAVILIALARRVPAGQQPEIILGAWRAADQIRDPDAKFTALSELLPLLAADEKAGAARQARTAAESIPAGLTQVRAFATLAGQVHDRAERVALLLRAEEDADAISEHAAKAAALAAVAARVTSKERRRALSGLAYDAACAETNPAARANALIELIALDPKPGQQRTAAEDAIGEIDQPTARAVALTALAGRLGKGDRRSAVLARALAEASAIDDAPTRAVGLGALIPHVPEWDNPAAEFDGRKAINQALDDALASSHQTQVAVAAALAPVAREDRAAILHRATLATLKVFDPPDLATACTVLIPLLTGTPRDEAIGRASGAAAAIGDQRQRRAALLALLAVAPDAVRRQAVAVLFAVADLDDRLGELRGTVVAAEADIEDRSSMLAGILSAPAPVRSGDIDLLPPETGLSDRRAVSQDAEPVISAVGALRTRAAALLTLTEACADDAVSARLAPRTAHAVDQARQAMHNAQALLLELPEPLHDQLLAAGQEVDAAARLTAPDSPEPARTGGSPPPARHRPGSPQLPGSMPPWAPDWRGRVDAAAARGRDALVSELPALVPAIAQHGGGAAVTTAAQALLTVGRWWS